ncbi:hypothetical protein Tco_1366375, partial [Tanacetum coccineum]
LFELSELRAQSQAKDIVIVKLKEQIKSLNGNVDKKVRFAESLTSSENTKTDSTSNIVSNKRVLPPHNLGRNRVNTYAVRITMLIADIEDDIMDPVMQCTTLPSHSGFSQQKLVSFVTEIHTTSINFLTPS